MDDICTYECCVHGIMTETTIRADQENEKHWCDGREKCRFSGLSWPKSEQQWNEVKKEAFRSHQCFCTRKSQIHIQIISIPRNGRNAKI